MSLAIVKLGGEYNSTNYMEGQILEESELDSIDTAKYAPESKVWLPDYSKVWNLGVDHQWYRVI